MKLQTKKQISLIIYGFGPVTMFPSTSNKNCTLLGDHPRNGGQVIKELLKISGVDPSNTITKSNNTNTQGEMKVSFNKIMFTLFIFCLFTSWIKVSDEPIKSILKSTSPYKKEAHRVLKKVKGG